MKTGTFLDMDMAQLGAGLRDGWHWWVDELAAMVPTRWQRQSAQKISGIVAFAEPDGSISVDGVGRRPDPDSPVPERTTPVTILMHRARALIRSVELPPLRRSELRKLVALDLDRLMPFPAASAWADVNVTGATTEDGRVEAHVAAMPKAELTAIVEAARLAGLSPRAIGIAALDQEHLAFDFLPAMAADGVVPPPSGATRWWVVVALLFALNIGAMVWKDVHRVSELQALVDAQQPLVTASRRLTNAMTGEDKVRAELLDKRRRDNALAALATVTRTLPAGAWVQRYSWTGEALRISGYKQPQLDVLGALRKSGAFTSVQATTSDVAVESGGGQPFDITAQWATQSPPEAGSTAP